MMPPTGRSRLLFVYFIRIIRIIAAFKVMWLPYLILVFVAGGWPSGVWAGGTWSHFQGANSAGLSLLKQQRGELVWVVELRLKCMTPFQ
jgi:hypothetical protein